jgi:hypothetical protein
MSMLNPIDAGFEHRHDGYDFSILDKYAVLEKDYVCIDPTKCFVCDIDCIFSCHLPGAEERKKQYYSQAVDDALQISKAYLESVESGRRIQSKTVDNYLRLFFVREIAFARSGNSAAE